MKNAVLLGLVAVWLWPLAAGVCDVGCWLAASHACTAIDWNGERTFVAAAWVALMWIPVAATASVIDHS